MDLKGLWQAVLGELEISISRANFATWFKHTAIVSSVDGHVVIAVPNIFTKEWLEKKYHRDITTALEKVSNGKVAVEYKIGEAAVVTMETPAVEAAPEQMPARAAAVEPAAGSLNAKYTFDNYVVGSSNELAYAACQAVAKHPGSKYNPLFLYGGVGLGKTHLMQAVGNEICRGDSSKRVEYVTSEGFTNEFLSSLARKRTDTFAGKYRKIDVLIVDDIQFLANKERTVEEFFHTFNTLHQANKQIIISSDKPPQAIAGLEERLKSRFASGMMADISAPDLETRSAILQRKAQVQGQILPPEVVDFLARTFSSNIRELEGALIKLLAHCELYNVEPTLVVAKTLLGGLNGRGSRPRSLTAKLVLERVAAYFDLRVIDLTGAKRDREIVTPRQIAMYLMRQELDLSYPKIAATVGGRDHTTAIHSVNKIERQLERDEHLRSEMASLKERIYA